VSSGHWLATIYANGLRLRLPKASVPKGIDQPHLAANISADFLGVSTGGGWSADDQPALFL